MIARVAPQALKRIQEKGVYRSAEALRHPNAKGAYRNAFKRCAIQTQKGLIAVLEAFRHTKRKRSMRLTYVPDGTSHAN
jgi:hypothetical protein